MEPIKTLLITGENNHDWTRSSVYCAKLLEQSEKFIVDIKHPSEIIATDKLHMSYYSLIFLDYNGTDWEPQLQAQFLEAVSKGTGLVALHASSNSFSNWGEYAKLLGVVWTDQSAHGEFHEFEIKVSNAEHPITRNLANFFTWDELYHNQFYDCI